MATAVTLEPVHISPELRHQLCAASPDRESLSRLQTALPADDVGLDAVIGQLLAQNAIVEFTCVLFAALGANRPVEAGHLVKGAGVLVEAECFSDITMRLQGNVAHYLFEALDKEPFHPLHHALILLLIAVWSRERAHAGFPRELFLKTHELLRMSSLDEYTIGLLMSLALYTEDEDLLESLRKQHYPMTPEKKWRTWRRRAFDLVRHISNLGKTPLFDRLPATKEAVVAFGTIRQSAPGVGRNEPCPCGSGKKYKRCCADRDRRPVTGGGAFYDDDFDAKIENRCYFTRRNL